MFLAISFLFAIQLSGYRLSTPTPPQEPEHKAFSGVSVSIRQLLSWGISIEQGLE